MSHDIKTPLTSIINYVDILKRENFQDPKIQNYLNILEMKAQRLKTLTEDVVEASKVSSGNIKLEFMTLNLVELIYQVEGEYEEKFEARNIKVILNMPDEPVTVGWMAEGCGGYLPISLTMRQNTPWREAASMRI